LIAKPGLDGHDRGAKVVARALRDAGFEVIYTGLHQSPEMVVNAAIQEDVDAVGMSVMSGAHNYLFPEVIRLLQERGAQDVLVFGGGIIPDEDMTSLKEAGAFQLYRPGASLLDIVRDLGEALGWEETKNAVERIARTVGTTPAPSEAEKRHHGS